MFGKRKNTSYRYTARAGWGGGGESTRNDLCTSGPAAAPGARWGRGESLSLKTENTQAVATSSAREEG